MSPSKGKAKEDTYWYSGWWEFYPLVERIQRPLEWSRSSTIFTSHPTQPLIVARLLTSANQFILPSPSPVATSPLSYDPPTIITVTPTDDWLFAYFPGRREGDGVGCLWRKGPQADNWAIKEWWGVARGAGVVATAWASPDREWVTNDLGSSSRLPPRGPHTPVSSPTLLLVTQNHLLQVCYLRAYIPLMKIMSCSLQQPCVTVENHPTPVYDVANGPGGIKFCSNAAIGLTYNEPSILIAMRSHLFPLPTASTPAYNAMDLSLPLELSHQSQLSVPALFRA
jgi:hypothetical protein